MRDFKYGEKVYYEDHNGEIKEALFSEGWDHWTTYLRKKGKEFSVYSENVYRTKKEILQKQLKQKREKVTKGDHFVETWNAQKEILEKEVKVLELKIKNNT